MAELNHTFNPNSHLMQISKKDYLPVQWRLVWINDVVDQAAKEGKEVSLEIDTEEIACDIDKEITVEISVWNNNTRRMDKVMKTAPGYAKYRATVTLKIGNIVKHATATKNENAASFAEYIEKAECVPLDSEILTRRGFKRYDELTIGEEVLAYDVEQDQCVWTPLQRVVTYENAPLVRLYGKWFEAFCTSEHTWPICYKSVSNEKVYEYRKLRETNQLSKNHNITLAAFTPEGTHPITPRDAAILGWLITDGCIRQKGNSIRSYICQSKQENVSIIRELVGTLAKETVHNNPPRTFPSGRTYECLPQHRFDFGAEETRRIFAVAGIASIEELPSMVTQYSHEARQAMLIAMMLADGDNRGYFGKKRKPGVMETWQILATLEGFALSTMYTSTVGEVPIQRMKKRRTVCASELQIEDAGMAPVWCPTTAYGTWIMRQNGRVMITGNTGAIGRALAMIGFGTQFAPEFDEEQRIVDSPVDRTPTPTNNSNNNRSETDEGTVTEQQVSSIRKLCQHLGKNEPDNVTKISFLSAKRLIQQLIAEYKESRSNNKAS